jgi:hypothetical protein
MSRTLKKRLRRRPLSFYQPSILNLLLVTTLLLEAGPAYTWQLSRTLRISP